MGERGLVLGVARSASMVWHVYICGTHVCVCMSTCFVAECLLHG